MNNIVLAIIDKDEISYATRLYNCMPGHKIKVYTGNITTSTQLEQYTAKAGITKIVTTREDILKKLLPAGREKKAKIKNYSGSLFSSFTYNKELEILIIPGLKQLITVPYMQWMMERFCSKICSPNKWHKNRKVSDFKYSILNNSKSGKELEELREIERNAILMSVDIETAPPDSITCIGFCYLTPDNSTHTYVLELKSMDDVILMRSLCASPVPKVLQNGKYDAFWLARYNSPLSHYYHDTVNALHAWYSELPKDLAFIQNLFIRNSMYWKDLGDSSDREERLKYNAMDCWSTLESYISWIYEAPQWAKNNYVMEFSQVPICHMMELNGIKRDMIRLEEENKKGNKKLDSLLTSLRKQVGHKDFNPSSPKQVLTLLKVLGNKDVDSSNEATIQKCILRSPLNERILGNILEYRGERKLISTYLGVGDKSKEHKGRIYYSINPHGTETGRKASRESALYIGVGLQIQNIPGHGPVKDTLIADDGYDLYEFDYSQAEARGVAYCSGDEHLLEAVESENDFHSYNASKFFGIPYEEIYSNEEHKVLNKDIRDLSKRVNHGANYNMMALMLLLTMGEKNVRKAQLLLKLPRKWNLIDVTKYLLQTYEDTYPRVKGAYYNKIKADIRKGNKLVGATGWTRWCFGDPSMNKKALNEYVAHVTQSLNAMILDIAILKIANKYLIDQDMRVKFLAQIHDSFFCMIKQCEAQDKIAQDIKNLMTFPVPVTDCIGKVRNMIVPVDIKKLGHRWSGNV